MPYRLIVEFTREQADDADCICARERIEHKDLTPQHYIKQLAMELQDAYDETAMSGQFQVIGITGLEEV